MTLGSVIAKKNKQIFVGYVANWNNVKTIPPG